LYFTADCEYPNNNARILNPINENNIVLYLLSAVSKNPNFMLNPKNPKPMKKDPNTILNKNPNTILNKYPKNHNEKKNPNQRILNHTGVEWSGGGGSAGARES
jgi:hypothetical protein